MNVLVDTSVWSLALRRRGPGSTDEVKALQELVVEGRVVMLGPIRQELLSGIKRQTQFDALRARLEPFEDLALETADYEQAAACFNTCRAAGVQGSNTDFLICAAAIRRALPIFTTDKDFTQFAEHIPVRLYSP